MKNKDEIGPTEHGWAPLRRDVMVRLDLTDLMALDRERQRRAGRGRVADRSELIREAIRAAFGDEAVNAK